jgi:hypothetical protein
MAGVGHDNGRFAQYPAMRGSRQHLDVRSGLDLDRIDTAASRQHRPHRQLAQGLGYSLEQIGWLLG